MDKPDSAPAPINKIVDSSNHQGIPRFLVGEMLRSACTIFSLLVHRAVNHNVIIAITKPRDIPINTLSKLNEYAMPSAPALANTLLNAAETTQANNNPNKPPNNDAIEEVNIPSMSARARMSDLFRPMERIIASSTRLDSANIMTMVRTSNNPAPIVNEPNTKNIADNAPAPSSALARAFSFAGTILKFIESTPETESSHWKMSD